MEEEDIYQLVCGILLVLSLIGIVLLFNFKITN